MLKADVSGSLEAFEDEIAKLPQDEVAVNIIHTGVGGINESDVMLAAASDAVDPRLQRAPGGRRARRVAEREGVEIRTYSVIYKALDDLRDAMTGMLEPEEVEDTVGTVEVRADLPRLADRHDRRLLRHRRQDRARREGPRRARRHRHLRHDDRHRSSASTTTCARSPQGFECGIVLANFQDVKEGDVLEVYETRQVERELELGAPLAVERRASARTSRCCSSICTSPTPGASRPSARSSSR